MPNTVGTPGYIGQVQKMDKTTAADGTLFDAIHQQLLNNDAFLNSEIIGMLQKAVNSGVTDFSSIAAGLTSNLNAFKFGKGGTLVNGILNALTNYGGMTDGSNLVQLDAPPVANVTPSLPGSARDDLVFLEFYMDTTGAPKWRIRVVDGVDFATYPEGINHTALVKAQGGQATPTTYTFTKSTTDNGLYVAGTGSGADQTGLATLDGYVNAIPLFRVRRRNNTGFDPDSNPMGAKDYFSVSGGTFAWTAGSSISTFTTASDLSSIHVGDKVNVINSSGSMYAPGATVQSISGGTVILTLTAPGTTATGSQTGTIMVPTSDRPDGLFSNIIDALDITDLRHQVSLTGFNYQALLEKNLDLLLHGQLTTKENTRFGRDYIGLNVAAGMPDNANTLLRCLFNGSIDGTANGSPVTGTMNTGSATFANGVQGQSLSASTSQYASYPVSIASGVNTYSIELLFKPNWNWNDGIAHGLMALMSGSPAYSTNVVSVFKNVANALAFIVSNNSANALASCLLTLPQSLSNSITQGTWCRLLIIVNNGVVTAYLNGVQLTAAGSLVALPVNVSTTVIGKDFSYGAYANAAIDAVRISNIARSEGILPSNFSILNGDQILDGPNGDFAQWSDDLGGTAGINGRTNPYGLSRVPNNVACRTSINGQELRHYMWNGLTPGWSASGSGASVAGSSINEYSAELAAVPANENADGSRTTFSFTAPAPFAGIFVPHYGYPSFVQVNGSYVTPTSMTYNATTKVCTVVLSSAPSAGQPVKCIWDNVQRHVHFIPSTKGFFIHDWTDDVINAGTNPPTTYQTSKYNVTLVNSVRVTPNGSSDSALQNGGYTVSGTGARSTLMSPAASGATTLSVANGANFVSGQNIRISKGDGTWYTTTVTSVSGNTLTVPATTVDLAQNTVIEGTVIVTFTTAPAASSIVDIVYESVYTPALGDYIRVMYQYTPYQGIGPNASLVLLDEHKLRVTSYGTGKVNTGAGRYSVPITTQLPIGTGVSDSSFKSDGISNALFSTGRTDDFILSNVPSVDMGPSIGYGEPISGLTTLAVSGSALRGAGNLATAANYLYGIGIPLTSSIPHLSFRTLIVKDTSTGELYLAVSTMSNSGTDVRSGLDGSSPQSVDFFKLQGRPLIKNYGGVAA